MGRQAPTIELLPRQRTVLEALSRTRKTAACIAERVAIILGCATGRTTLEQAALLNVDPQRVARWRARFSEAKGKLTAAAADDVEEKQLTSTILEVLSDDYRSGAPAKFTAEQLIGIIALACQQPSELGLPVTHWTPRELAAAAAERGIVESISPRHVARFLEDADLHPHRSSYWLNSKITDEAEHDAAVSRVCETYRQAHALLEEGVHVVSCDEKTSIQALERAAPTKPMQQGRQERREFEYIRHGTLCLTANLEVATGRVIAPTVWETRSEEDFHRHVQQTVATDAEAGWVFVVDNLNTHCSASLVRWIAELERATVDLGRKGKDGVLKDVKSRTAYLSDTTHRVRFVYTPKHCSWLNQVEIWFSILARRALKRASFRSTEELGTTLLRFIEYFNRLLAKPMRWTYTGRPLTV